jgi:hypothetical protein
MVLLAIKLWKGRIDFNTFKNYYGEDEKNSGNDRCGVVWCGVVWCGVVWCGVVWCTLFVVYYVICSKKVECLFKAKRIRILA